MEGGEIWYENILFDPLRKEDTFSENTSKAKNLSFDDVIDVDENYERSNANSNVFFFLI